MRSSTTFVLTLLPALLATSAGGVGVPAYQVLLNSANMARTFERLNDASHFFFEAASIARKQNLVTVELGCLSQHAQIVHDTGRPAEAETVFRRLLELQRTSGFPEERLDTTRLLLAHSLIDLNRFDEAASLAKSLKDPLNAAHFDTLMGRLHHRRGDPVAAERHLRRSASRIVQDRRPLPHGLPCPLQTLGSFYLATNRPDAAEGALRRALEHARPTAPVRTIRLCIDLARLCLEDEQRVDEARSHLDLACSTAQQSATETALRQVVEFLLERGLEQRARALLEQLADRFRVRSDVAGLRRVALVYRSVGFSADAARTFECLLGRLDSGSTEVTSYLGILVIEEYSIVLWLLGREEDATRLTERVPALLHRIGDDSP